MPTDEQIAAELVSTLMRHTATSGPLTAVKQLTRVLRVLRIVTRVITHERNKRAYLLTCYRSHRRVADLAGVSASTMQRWMEAGSPNGSVPLDDDVNSDSNGDE